MPADDFAIDLGAYFRRIGYLAGDFESRLSGWKDSYGESRDRLILRRPLD